jgi:hypothetical protein
MRRFVAQGLGPAVERAHYIALDATFNSLRCQRNPFTEPAHLRKFSMERVETGF